MNSLQLGSNNYKPIQKLKLTIVNKINNTIQPLPIKWLVTVSVFFYFLNENLFFIFYKQLKNEIEKVCHINANKQRLFLCNKELRKNNQLLHSLGIGQQLSFCFSNHTEIYLTEQPKYSQMKIGYIKVIEHQIIWLKGLEIYSSLNEKMEEIFEEIQKGFSLGYKPKLTDDGSFLIYLKIKILASGTYFLKSSKGQNIAVFKPQDEEPFAPKNPRGYIGKLCKQFQLMNQQKQLVQEGFRQGILSGESASREVAAFMLDNECGGFYNVPPTTYVEVYHQMFNCQSGNNQTNHLMGWSQLYLINFQNIEQEIDSESTLVLENSNDEIQNSLTNKVKNRKFKKGSLQTFVYHHDTVGNYGSSVFSIKLNSFKKEVHKIAILDIRILNCDRNDENILVLKTLLPKQNPKDTKRNFNFSLIPIDHGLSFPDCFEIQNYEICWMDYSQVKEPFSQQELIHIRKINPDEDIKLLKSKLSIRKICLRNFKIAGIVLKRCAEAGLTLFDIGQILYKEDPEELSIIQQIIQRVDNYCKKVNKDSRWRNILQFNNRVNQENQGDQQQQFFFNSRFMPSPQKIDEENESCCESQQDMNEMQDLGNIPKLAKFQSSSKKNQDLIQEEDEEEKEYFEPIPGINRKNRLLSENLDDDFLRSQNLEQEAQRFKASSQKQQTEEVSQENQQPTINFQIKRALSDQDLSKIQEEDGRDKQCVLNELKQPYQSNSRNQQKDKISIQKKKEESNEDEEKIQDELFFRCFEDFLKQEITMYQKTKK